MFEAQQKPKRADEQVLPLINIVFLLLIFFMLAGSLTASDPFPVNPPSSSSGEAAEPGDIRVLLARDGRLAIDGVAVDDARFDAAIDERIGGNDARRIWLRADANADMADVIALMERLQAAGAGRVTLLTVRATP